MESDRAVCKKGLWFVKMVLCPWFTLRKTGQKYWFMTEKAEIDIAIEVSKEKANCTSSAIMQCILFNGNKQPFGFYVICDRIRLAEITANNDTVFMY